MPSLPDANLPDANVVPPLPLDSHRMYESPSTISWLSFWTHFGLRVALGVGPVSDASLPESGALGSLGADGSGTNEATRLLPPTALVSSTLRRPLWAPVGPSPRIE